MENEIWRPVKGYEDYMVSNCGRVKNLNYRNTHKEAIIKNTFDNYGYLVVGLYRNGKLKNFKVHRLVAIAFIPNPNNLPQVNHKNEDKADNRVKNLEWCDAKYNINFGMHNHLVSRAKRNNLKVSYPVIQYSLNGKFINDWPSTREIQRQLGYRCEAISRCCNGKQKTAYGYIWKYKKAV